MDTRTHSTATKPPGQPEGPVQSAADRALILLERDLGSALRAYAATKSAERSWQRAKTYTFVLFIALSFGLYLYTWGDALGIRVGPSSGTVAIVHLSGVIDDVGLASGRRLVPLIDRTCANDDVEALVIKITSPGGSPSQAARIARALERCRASRHIPILAVIEGQGASAAYLIAVSADRIVADPYAAVGSIGAVISGFEASGLLAKAGVQTRSYASGELKTMLSAWRPDTTPQAQAAQALVDDVAAVFVETVKHARGAQLKADPTLFSGRVWISAEARDLGLVDEVAVIDDVLARDFPELTPYHYTAQPTLPERMDLRAIGAGLWDAVLAEEGAWTVH